MKPIPNSVVSTACATLVATCVLIVPGCTGGRESPEVTFERGRLLADRGQFEDAIPLYETSLKGLPDRAVTYYERGRAYEELGRLEKAVKDYSTCLEKDPQFLQALNNKGVVLAKMERFEEAAAEFGKLIAGEPNDVLALRNRGLCYHDQGKFEQALTDYDKALSVDEQDTPTWFQRGNVFLQQKKFAEAITNYDKAITLDANYAKAWMNRGVARYGLNQREAALKDLLQAQLLDDSIVLPGIDWLTAGTETAEVTELTVAKPVFVDASISAQWAELLQAAQSTLAEKNFENAELTVALPEQLCGKFAADIDGKAAAIYFGVENAESDTVSLPAIDGSDGKLALLVLTRPSPDAAFTLERFVDDWMPEPQAIVPKVIGVKLPAE